jgi:hypothetical protein
MKFGDLGENFFGNFEPWTKNQFWSKFGLKSWNFG